MTVPVNILETIIESLELDLQMWFRKINQTSNSCFSFCKISSNSAILRLDSDVLTAAPDLFSAIWLRAFSASENRRSTRSTTYSQVKGQISHRRENSKSTHPRFFLSVYLIGFFPYPFLLLVREIYLGRWKINRKDINCCISKASDHFPESA